MSKLHKWTLEYGCRISSVLITQKKKRTCMLTCVLFTYARLLSYVSLSTSRICQFESRIQYNKNEDKEIN